MSSEGVYRKIVQYEWTDALTVPSPVKGTAPPVTGGNANTTVGVATGNSPSSASALHGGLKREFYGGAIACGEKKAYLIGGYDAKKQCMMNQVVEFSLTSKQWSRQVHLPERRSQATAVAFEDFCFVWGGWDGTDFCDGLWVLGTGFGGNKESGATEGGGPTSTSTGGAGSARGATKEGAGTHGGAAGHGSSGHGAASNTTSSAYRWKFFPAAGTSMECPCPVPSARIGHSLVLGHVTRSTPWYRDVHQNSSPGSAGSSSPMGPNSHRKGVDPFSATHSTTPPVSASMAGGSPSALSPSSGHASSITDGKRTTGSGGGPPVSTSPSLASSSLNAVGSAYSSPGATGGGNTGHHSGTTSAPAPTTVNPTSTSGASGGGGIPVVEPVLYLFGGFDGKRRLNDVWRLYIRPSLEMKEAVWEEVTVKEGMLMKPSPRDDAAVAFAFASEKLYVFGGYDNALCNDLHVLELKDGKNQWLDVPVLGPPTRRQGGIAAADENNVVLCMGCTSDQQSIPQLLQISLKENKWKILAVEQCVELLSERDGYVGCCGAGNKRLLFYGGGGGPTPFKTSMVEIELERTEPTTVSGKKK